MIRGKLMHRDHIRSVNRMHRCVNPMKFIIVRMPENDIFLWPKSHDNSNVTTMITISAILICSDINYPVSNICDNCPPRIHSNKHNWTHCEEFLQISVRTDWLTDPQKSWHSHDGFADIVVYAYYVFTDALQPWGGQVVLSYLKYTHTYIGIRNHS